MADSPHRAHAPTGREQQPTGWDQTIVAQPAFIIRSGGELQGRVLELRPGTQVIGRQPGCELRIDDGFVSRRHAIVLRDRDASWLEDAGSANGTSLNGEQLRSGRRRPLRSGDAVRIGRIDLVYLDGSETPTHRKALLQPSEAGPLVEVLSRSPTDDTPPLLPPATLPPAPKPKADASPLTPMQLALSAAAASLTALLLSRRDVGQLGTTVGAGLTTVVTTFLQTRGRKQWLRVATGAGLALALAVTGVTLPELAFGSKNRPLTFVPPKLDPRTTVPATSVDPSPTTSVDPNPVDCGAAPSGQEGACSIEIGSPGPGGNGPRLGEPPTTTKPAPPPRDPVRFGPVTTAGQVSDTSIADDRRALTTAFSDFGVAVDPTSAEPEATKTFTMTMPLTDGAARETLWVYAQGSAFSTGARREALPSEGAAGRSFRATPPLGRVVRPDPGAAGQAGRHLPADLRHRHRPERRRPGDRLPEHRRHRHRDPLIRSLDEHPRPDVQRQGLTPLGVLAVVAGVAVLAARRASRRFGPARPPDTRQVQPPVGACRTTQ